MLCRCTLIVPGDDCSSTAISLFESPRATSNAISRSRDVRGAARKSGEVLRLLEIWRGASFACESATGFGEPSKGAPHGDEITCFAAHAGRVDGADRGSSFHSFSEG